MIAKQVASVMGVALGNDSCNLYRLRSSYEVKGNMALRHKLNYTMIEKVVAASRDALPKVMI